jgi:cytochrome c oxidase subunit II
MKHVLMAAGIALGLSAGLAYAAEEAAPAAGDAAKGKTAFAVCEACHGKAAEGNKELGAPQLAGQEPWYLVRQLQNFKSGARGADPKDTFGTQMRPMAQTLADDAAIANVVAYIGTLKPAAPAATVKGDAEAGKAAYGTCAACHGAKAEGNKALNAPALAGQHDWYVVRQLQNFKSGLRGSAPGDTFGAQMKPMAATLADQAAIDNVAAYIATLK